MAFPTLMPAIHRADGSVVVGQRLQPRVLAGPVAIEDLRLLPPAHRRARGLNVSACSRRSAGWWCGWRRTPPGVRVSAMNSSIRCFRGGAPVAFIAASDSAGSSTFTIGRRDGSATTRPTHGTLRPLRSGRKGARDKARRYLVSWRHFTTCPAAPRVRLNVPIDSFESMSRTASVIVSAETDPS